MEQLMSGRSAIVRTPRSIPVPPGSHNSKKAGSLLKFLITMGLKCGPLVGSDLANRSISHPAVKPTANVIPVISAQ